MIPFSPPDYELKDLLSENPHGNLWLAEQISVRRKVIIEQLPNPTQEMRDSFFATIRAKAAMDHPLVASVIEAVNNTDYCFFAREWLPGVSLQELINMGETLPPVKIAHILKRVAEAQIHNEQRSVATERLTLGDIYLDDHNVMRLDNLAIAGARVEGNSRDDLQALGTALPALVRQTTAGASRVITLLAWMTGTVTGQVVSWTDVRYYADQIDQQLATAAVVAQKPMASTTKKAQTVSSAPWVIGLVSLAAVAIAAVILMPKNESKPQVKAILQPIKVPATEHVSSTGHKTSLREFWLSAHEVTIEEYRGFLVQLAELKEDQRNAFDHEAQPPQKKNHLPKNWQEILAAATDNQVWDNRKLSLSSPVFGVDWWDAYAYCEWKRGRLPSQEEWDTALRMNNTDVSKLKPLVWSDVTQEESTPAGFTGMAGGVKEWLRKPITNPGNPLAPPQWVLSGASCANPQGGAALITFVVDRNERNDDYGIRVAYEHQAD